MSKGPCRPHTGNTQWSMWICLLTWDCLLHYNFHNTCIAYKKNVQPCKMRSWIENELIELINSDQFRLSIPIQFQFKIFQFNSKSIHAELNWIDYQFQFNSWIDPSPALQGVWKTFSASVQSMKPKMFFSLIHSFISKFRLQRAVLSALDFQTPWRSQTSDS